MLGATTTFALSASDRALMLDALVHASECDALGSDQEADADSLLRQLKRGTKRGTSATRLTVNCGRVLVMRYAVQSASESEAFNAWNLTLGRLYRRLEHAGYRILR